MTPMIELASMYDDTFVLIKFVTDYGTGFEVRPKYDYTLMIRLLAACEQVADEEHRGFITVQHTMPNGEWITFQDAGDVMSCHRVSDITQQEAETLNKLFKGGDLIEFGTIQFSHVLHTLLIAYGKPYTVQCEKATVSVVSVSKDLIREEFESEHKLRDFGKVLEIVEGHHTV